MQAKSAAWYAALTAASAEWRYGLDILASDETTPLEDTTQYDLSAQDRLVDASAQVTLDITAKSHRTFKLNLRNTDGRYLPGPAGYPSGGAGSPTATGLVWYTARFRPWMDLMTGFDSNNNKIYDRTYLGIYVLTQPDVQVKNVGTQTTLTLIDKSALLCKPFLILASNLPIFYQNAHPVGGYPSGMPFDVAMTDLAVRAGVDPHKISFTPSTLNLPANYTITEGTEWWTHLQALAASIAHVIYFDGYGNLIRRADPLLTNAASVYTFAPGPLSIVSDILRSTSLNNTYNHTIVIGASAQTTTVRGEAQILDATNPYHKNSIGDRIVFIGKGGKLDNMTPDPMIGTTAQANTKAQVFLAQHIGQQETITMKARNIPALEPFDRITINIPQSGLNMDVMISQMSWNLYKDYMQIDAAKWFAVGT